MKESPTRIFLVGPMGAGKTTIGNQLARALKLKFIDCDQELEKRTGASVSLIFDIEGEAGFRERETRLVEELTASDDIVLATGGGAVLAADNRRWLRDRGVVVYLKTPVDKLVERTRHDAARPLLRTPDPEATLRAIVTAREALYEEVAHLVIDTGRLSVKQVIKNILGNLP